MTQLRNSRKRVSNPDMFYRIPHVKDARPRDRLVQLGVGVCTVTGYYSGYSWVMELVLLRTKFQALHQTSNKTMSVSLHKTNANKAALRQSRL